MLDCQVCYIFPYSNIAAHSIEDAHTSHPTRSGVLISNDGNSSFSLFGLTSTFTLFDAMTTRPHFAKISDADSERPHKLPRRAPLESGSSSFASNQVSATQIYARNDDCKASRSKIKEHVANAHLDCFFNTAYDLFPILDEDLFRSMYHQFWNTPPSRAEKPQSCQWQCLIYSVLSLGALFSETGSNDIEWAANYFAEAQGLIGCLFGVNCLETVQAVMTMVRSLCRVPNVL